MSDEHYGGMLGRGDSTLSETEDYERVKHESLAFTRHRRIDEGIDWSLPTWATPERPLRNTPAMAAERGGLTFRTPPTPEQIAASIAERARLERTWRIRLYRSLWRQTPTFQAIARSIKAWNWRAWPWTPRVHVLTDDEYIADVWDDE
jgi:hypothetical protein